MANFVMPKLGADMNMGRLLSWSKNIGDRIERGEIIAEVHTDKADIEIESFISGVIEKYLIEPGEEVPIGTVIAIIRKDGEVTTTNETPVEIAAAPTVAPDLSKRETMTETVRLHISPVAKKLAAELGIDPTQVKGTGPGGRITREDIENAAKTKTEKPAPDRQTGMRQIIAAAMARAKREIPHYYLRTTIDLKRALDWLAQENEKRSVADRLLYGVLLIKAVAMALREVPELNATWENEQVNPKPSINVGIAISLRQGGLIAPALLDADKKSLDELMQKFRDMVQRARAGRSRSSELSDATITITNLGEQGVEEVFGIIYPPQVALVGFGKIVERPWAVNGMLGVRPIITATLSADHRVSDGHRGGLFLSALDRLLQEPENL
ncbi:MAG: 2-oxo acid dehydrogenase subunit E2 [Acidobacteria bacterium]|nr:2-oxo acid dehydrogenase subunit E2 [Acidobacteriota bacterium]